MDGGEEEEEEEEAPANFGLPDSVLHVLPSDPFEQLDVARKITSIALSTRVSALESESSFLRAKLAEKDDLIAHLHSQIESLDSSLAKAAQKLAQADQDKESLVRDNASLSNTVRKLSRDVAKLEVFRKTLMQSLQEDDENSARGPKVIAKPTPIEDDASLPPSRTSSVQSQVSESGNSQPEEREGDASRAGIPPEPLFASQTSTPRLTPPGSPPTLSASASPRTSKPVSPRRHSMSFSTSRGFFEDRSSISMSGSDAGSHAGRTRVDGKEFFRQVRSRLSYEQFGAFLANVKELNSHKQTKDDTLRKADEIFGPENKDLYVIFEGLITRNAH